LLFFVVENTPQETLSVVLPLPAAGPVESAAHLRCFADVLCSVGKLAATAAFASSKFFGAAAAARPEHLFAKDLKQSPVWKPEVLAIGATFRGVSAAALAMAGPLAVELDMYQTTPSVADLQNWLARAALVYPAWVSHVAAVAVQFTEDRTAELIKVTPVFKHFLTDSKLNEALARKNLLAASVRQPLADKTVHLVQVLKATRAALTDVVGDPLPQGVKAEESDPDVAAALKGADNAVTAATTAMAVIAGCSIVFEGGGQQVQDAKKLTLKPRPDVPKALWAALMRIAEGKGLIAAKVEAKAAKR
jgi:hypothetical protein